MGEYVRISWATYSIHDDHIHAHHTNTHTYTCNNLMQIYDLLLRFIFYIYFLFVFFFSSCSHSVYVIFDDGKKNASPDMCVPTHSKQCSLCEFCSLLSLCSLKLSICFCRFVCFPTNVCVLRTYTFATELNVIWPSPGNRCVSLIWNDKTTDFDATEEKIMAFSF